MSSNYEKEADRQFSLFIRSKYASHEGYVRCYTCLDILHWKEAQNGHFRLRGNDTVRYHEDNCRPQCFICNMQKNGMPESFEEHLREELGDEAVDDLIELSKETRGLSEEDYKAIIHKYRLINKRNGVV